MKNNNFIFNEDLCVGCEACIVACTMENGIDTLLRWRSIYTSNSSKFPGISVFNLSMSCNHCENPPCLLYCPANAYEIDDKTGSVLIISENCIGCEYCTWNCPYDAPKINVASGVIEKCTFCNSRLLDNKKPACANLCPTGALNFTIEDIQQQPVQSSIPTFPEPSIIINESVRKQAARVDKTLFKANKTNQINSNPEHSFTSLKELPLIIFTSIITLLIALSISFDIYSISNNLKVILIALLSSSMIISVLHLGKKLRFHRAILNLKRSWLSREILFLGIFSIIFLIDMLLTPIPKLVLVTFGLITLLSVDMIYKPLQSNWKANVHSGQTLIIVAALYLLFNNYFLVLSVFILLRLVYTLFTRKVDLLLILRYIFPLKGSILLFSSFSINLAIAMFLIGEIIDRILYYSDLRKYHISKYDY